MLPSEIKEGQKKKEKHENVFPWTREQEELLAEWSEKSTCYRWLHSRSEKSYRSKNYLFTIPVIILSTLTGTANFAMDSFVPEENKQIAMAAVGSVNIFAGILSTLQNFLRYAELMESHRLSEVQWSKFGRNIAVELALEPKRRKTAYDFLKVCRAEYDRLIEQSPPIDDTIIKQFKNTFKKSEIKKPDICNGLDKCKIYEPSKDDKLENMMVNVGQKLKNKKIGKWKSFKTDTMKPTTDQPITDKPTIPLRDNKLSIELTKNTSQKELEGLLSIARVSSFKNKLDTSKQSETIQEEINSLSNKPDIVIDIEKPETKTEDTKETKSETKPKTEDTKETKSEDKTEEVVPILEKQFLDGIDDN